MKVAGYCCICGLHRQLSFEHVPPRSAFNSVGTTLNAKILELGWIKTHGRSDGAGGYTLCASCNSKTGDLYSKHLVRLVKEAAELVDKVPVGEQVQVEMDLNPIFIIKQIMVMFCSTNGPNFVVRNPWLKQFIFNPHAMHWRPDLRIYLALHSGKLAFRQGIGVSLDTRSGRQDMAAEIIFPPLSYTLAIGGPPSFAVNFELFEISQWLRNYSPRYSGRVPLKLRHYRRCNMFLGDYRSGETIAREREPLVEDPKFWRK